MKPFSINLREGVWTVFGALPQAAYAKVHQAIGQVAAQQGVHEDATPLTQGLESVYRLGVDDLVVLYAVRTETRTIDVLSLARKLPGDT